MEEDTVASISTVLPSVKLSVRLHPFAAVADRIWRPPNLGLQALFGPPAVRALSCRDLLQFAPKLDLCI